MATVLSVGLAVVAAPGPALADALPLSYQVSAETGYDTPATLESAVFQWCQNYPIGGCAATETKNAQPAESDLSLNVRCVTSTCIGGVSTNVSQNGWYYIAGPGIAFLTAQDYVAHTSITLDGVIVGLGFITPGSCFILPRNWSVLYVHHITVELHSDGTFKVTVPDAKEPATDPGFGKPCQRPELVTYSATWSGQAAPGSFAIP